MASPVWKTTAGLIAIINERDYYSVQLEAEDLDSTALTYSKIAGTLPTGIELSSTGLLHGVPTEVATRIPYTFVARVSDGTNISDRSFTLQILGVDAPVFSTAAGVLNQRLNAVYRADDTTILAGNTIVTADTAGTVLVLDGSYIQYQISASDIDTATGKTLTYDIVSGRLPVGVTMTTSGLVSGIIELTDTERFNIYGDDSTTKTISRAENFTFTVRVSDGSATSQQEHNILVFTPDFWRVDNERLTIDGTDYETYPLDMSLSSSRVPIFTTDSALGSFRHDNKTVIKIDVYDADALQGALTYSIQSGSLPPGLIIDSATGEISGTLPAQSLVSKDYSFTVRASRTPHTGVTVFGERTFSITVIGDINIGVSFTSATALGTVTAGIPSLISLEATTVEANRVLEYSITSGSLPTGLTLSPAGNIIGTVDKTEFTTVDDNTITFDTNTLSIDRQYTFTVAVSDQYQSVATTTQFTLNVSLPYGVEYGNMTARGLISGTNRDLFYQLSQDPNINSSQNIFRPEDPTFGMRSIPEMLLIAGLEHKTLTVLQNQMEQFHKLTAVYFGDIKTAVAKSPLAITKYEVVYIEMKDDPLNKAITDMRTRMKLLGEREYINLPLWMKTSQDSSGVPLGYKMAIVLAYCKPGQSALVKKRIQDKKIDFKKINFVIDRYMTDINLVDTGTITADGSTTSFTLNEIVHAEEIKLRQDAAVLSFGKQVTADNNLSPLYLSADSQLRSADYEPQFSLSHDVDTQKTTINFTNAPTATSKIRVERVGDKYLAFRRTT
jgi:hypothetical protein